jgi:peptide-methionine (S)-S-oxide reductase
MIKTILLSIISFAGLQSCAQKDNSTKIKTAITTMTHSNDSSVTPLAMDTATFGTGCFWCTEAIFQQLEGVEKVTSGYSGGTVPNPTYEQICTKTTGHAECLNVLYNPAKISYEELLKVFWEVHDPTTLNRQGADVGTQYRSVIFYRNATQKALAQKYKAQLDKSGAWNNPIVTTLEPMAIFYPAEAYHQNYYNNNTSQGYCQFVIRPKLEKFEQVFKDKLKKKK